MKRLTLVPAIALAISALFLTTAGTASAQTHGPPPPSPAAHSAFHHPGTHSPYQGWFPPGFIKYYKHHHKKKHHFFTPKFGFFPGYSASKPGWFRSYSFS